MVQETADCRRIRVDHIGSLVRPEKLKAAFGRFDRGELSRQELVIAQDEAVRNIVVKQAQHGLLAVTDGEFRRHNFQESFSESVTGFDVSGNISRY